MDSRPAL